MTVLSPSGVRRLFAIVALAVALGGPAVAVGSQSDRATPAVTTPVAGGPVEPLATASVVPADVPLYVASTVDPDSEQWATGEALIRRAGLGDYLDQAIAEIQSDLATTEDDEVEAFLGGEVAIAVTDANLFMQTGAVTPPPLPPLSTPEPAQASATPAGFVAIIRDDDPDGAEAAALTLTTESAADMGGTLTETVYQGVTIHSAIPVSMYDEGAAFARLVDVIVVSSSAADLEPLIDVHAGVEPALANAEPFTRVRAELPNDFLTYGFVNGPAYRQAIEPLFAAAEAEMGAALPIDQTLAQLDAYSGYAIRADDLGFRIETITVPAAGATLPPLPANFESALDDRVPADSLLFVNGFDLGATLGPSLDAYGAFIAMAAAEDPLFPFPLPDTVTDTGQSDAIFDLAGRFLAFNPRTDLIENLIGEWAFALSVASPDPQGIGGVFVSGAGDELRLNDAMTKLAVWVNLLVIGGLAGSDGGDAALFGDQPVGAHTEEVNGVLTQVTEVPIPDTGTSTRLQWGVVDGELVFGVGDGFADYVAGPGDSLADSPRYRAAMDALPAEHNSIFYLDLAQTIELAQPFIDQELHAHDAALDLSAIQAFGAVTFVRYDLMGSSAILLIAEQ